MSSKHDSLLKKTWLFFWNSLHCHMSPQSHHLETKYTKSTKYLQILIHPRVNVPLKRERESVGDERMIMLMVWLCGGLKGIWLYKLCKVEAACIEEHTQQPPPNSLTSHPPLKGELYLHKSTSSKQQLCLFFVFLPLRHFLTLPPLIQSPMKSTQLSN